MCLTDPVCVMSIVNWRIDDASCVDLRCQWWYEHSEYIEYALPQSAADALINMQMSSRCLRIKSNAPHGVDSVHSRRIWNSVTISIMHDSYESVTLMYSPAYSKCLMEIHWNVETENHCRKYNKKKSSECWWYIPFQRIKINFVFPRICLE